VQSLPKVGKASNEKYSGVQVAVLMITQMGINMLEGGEDKVADEARNLLIDHLEPGNLAKI
jgi:hypothetical protein